MASGGGRGRVATAVALAGVCLTVACNDSEPGGDSAAGSGEPAPLATEPLPREQTAGCEEASVGGSDEGWRRFSVDTGPFGFYGSGAGFARPGYALETREGVKMPVVVAGDRRVVVSLASADRGRARFQYGFTGERTAAPVSRIAFEPCADRDATSWPGGLRITNTSEPIEVRVAVEGETEVRRLSVGDGRVFFESNPARSTR